MGGTGMPAKSERGVGSRLACTSPSSTRARPSSGQPQHLQLPKVDIPSGTWQFPGIVNGHAAHQITELEQSNSLLRGEVTRRARQITQLQTRLTQLRAERIR